MREKTWNLKTWKRRAMREALREKTGQSKGGLERERDLEAVVGVVVDIEVGVVEANEEFPSHHFFPLDCLVWRG